MTSQEIVTLYWDLDRLRVGLLDCSEKGKAVPAIRAAVDNIHTAQGQLMPLLGSAVLTEGLF